MKNEQVNLKKRSIVIISIISLMLLFMMISSALVCAIGFSPASKTLSFSSASTEELTFYIINSEQNELDIVLSASGELADIVFFENKTIHVNANDYRTPFKTMVKMPEELGPGMHSFEILLTPILPGVAEGDNPTIGAFIVIEMPVYVKVPYPSLYADVRFFAEQTEEGVPVQMHVLFDNLGSVDIASAGAEIEIYSIDKQDVPLLKINTSRVSVIAGSFERAYASNSPVLRKGAYQASVVSEYDGIRADFKTNFSLGEPMIRISELVSRELVAGEINRVFFRVKSEWNLLLHTKAFISINNVKNEMPGFVVEPEKEQVFSGFIDTSALEPGSYNLSIILAYDSQIRNYVFPVIIKSKQQVLSGKSSRTAIILAVLLVLVVLAALLIWPRLRKKNPIPERNL